MDDDGAASGGRDAQPGGQVLGADGKEQAASAPIELTVADGQVVVATPAPSAAATAAPGAGAPAIKLPAAGLQASEPLTLEGTGTPGSTVTVYDGDEVVGETTVGADGTWAMTVPPLAAGTHNLVAKQVGADGKEQGASAPVELTVADGQIVVATPAPSAAATAVPGAGAPAIKLPAAGLKASEPLTLEGTGTPGSTVTVYDGDEVVGETTVGRTARGRSRCRRRLPGRTAWWPSRSARMARSRPPQRRWN